MLASIQSCTTRNAALHAKSERTMKGRVQLRFFGRCTEDAHELLLLVSKSMQLEVVPELVQRELNSVLR
eukprot:6004344-Amphidinium_carterae.1